MGKRIVINSYGSAGDLNPFFVVGRALQSRGHHVVVATDDCSRSLVESAGLEFSLARRSFLYGGEDVGEAPSFNIRHSYDDLLAAVRGADLLITYQIAFAGPLVAASTGIPWVSVVLSPFTFGSPYELPMLWASPHERPFTPAVYRLYLSQLSHMTHVSRLFTRRVQRLRGALGLVPAKSVLFADHHSPDLVLALFSRAYAATQPDWPAQTRVAGFAFDEHLTGGQGLPPELARFLDAGPLPVVFTLGSSSVFDGGSFCLQSLAAAKLLGRRAVLLGSFGPGFRFPDGPDVISVEYAPYGELLPRAAAIVHHGGIGTIALALRAGCPMLAIPAYAWDQPDNTARAAGLGAARMMALDEYNGLSAAAELARLLSDPGYAERAARVSRAVRAEDGAAAACDEIERYLERVELKTGSGGPNYVGTTAPRRPALRRGRGQHGRQPDGAALAAFAVP